MKKNCNQQNYAQGQLALRKTIPLRLSSILKSSQIIQQTNIQTQCSNQYDVSKPKSTYQSKTPLIKNNTEKNKSSVLFVKNPRKTTSLLEGSKLNNLSQITVSKTQPRHSQMSNQNNCQDRVDQKVMEIIGLVNGTNKNQLNRIRSCMTLNFNEPASPLIRIKDQNQDQINLPKRAQSYYVREDSILYRQNSHSFLFPLKNQSNGIKGQVQQNPLKRNLTKSTFLQKNNKTVTHQKIASHYVPNKKLLIQQYRLCINCETYVDKNLIAQHQDKCLGFKIILKMQNDELIDFLDDKIQKKLNQLTDIDEKINLAKEQGLLKNCTTFLSLYQTKNKIDKILTGIDSIRLKALKRIHTRVKPR